MKKILYLIVLLVFFTGCSVKRDESQDINTLTLWGGYSLVGDAEMELSQEEWVLNRLIRQYEQENTNIKINYVYFEDENLIPQMLKGSIGSAEEPDMIVTLSGRYLENYEGMLLPLNDLLSQNLLNNMIGWESVKDEHGQLMGVPAAGCDGTFIAYNKSLIDKAGLDFENNPPLSKDEFFEDLEILSEAGIIPIVVSDDGWNSLHSTIFGKWWLQQEDDDIFERLMANEVDFEKDLPFLDSFRLANECYEKGYINRDFVTNTDALTQFLNGQGAMYISSAFSSSLLEELGNDLGVIPIPDYSSNCNFQGMSLGGSSQCISVLRSTNLKEECIHFLEWLFQKENSIKMQKVYSGLPGRKDITIENLGWEDKLIYQKLPFLNETAKLYPELILSPAQTEIYFVYGPQAISGNISPEELATKMNSSVSNEKK